MKHWKVSYLTRVDRTNEKENEMVVEAKTIHEALAEAKAVLDIAVGTVKTMAINLEYVIYDIGIIEEEVFE